MPTQNRGDATLRADVAATVNAPNPPGSPGPQGPEGPHGPLDRYEGALITTPLVL